MINRIYETVKTYLNTDQRGNFAPSKFDLVLNNKVEEGQKDLFFEVNRAINRQNRGLINGGLENLTEKIREKIQHYLEPEKALVYSGGKFTLPTDLRYFDLVMYNGEPIEMCKSLREFKAFDAVGQDAQYPIGIKQGSNILVSPSTITTNVTASYIRNPKQAKWTYTVVDGAEIFNPDSGDFVDVDIHPSEEEDLTMRVLQAFGINLKEADIQKITMEKSARDYNHENDN